MDVRRITTEGFARGHLDIAGLGQHQRQTMRIRFQNENLVAHVDGRLAACVPDLICLLESEGVAAGALCLSRSLLSILPSSVFPLELYVP
jgi:DUF917 family protein